MNNDLISRSALIDTFCDTVFFDEDSKCKALELIDNAPTIEQRDNFDLGYIQGLEDGKKERTQGEYVDISKLRLMTVEECAGHTIDYAIGWKACIEWIKKGGAKND